MSTGLYTPIFTEPISEKLADTIMELVNTDKEYRTKPLVECRDYAYQLTEHTSPDMLPANFVFASPVAKSVAIALGIIESNVPFICFAYKDDDDISWAAEKIKEAGGNILFDELHFSGLSKNGRKYVYHGELSQNTVDAFAISLSKVMANFEETLSEFFFVTRLEFQRMNRKSEECLMAKALFGPVFENARVIDILLEAISMEKQAERNELLFDNMDWSDREVSPRAKEIISTISDMEHLLRGYAEQQGYTFKQFNSDNDLETLLDYMRETSQKIGLRSAVEAANAGVPVDDIIA